MKKRVLALLLSAMMAVSITAGCSKSSNKVTGNKSSTPYTVNFMYICLNPNLKGQDEVFKKISDLSLKQINIKVNMIPVAFGSFAQQLQLMFASNEALDVFPMAGNNAPSYISNGYIVNMSSLIDKYGTNSKKIFGKDAKMASMNGFVFALTSMREWENPVGIVMRTDILQKCGIDASNIKDFTDMSDVFAKVKAQYPKMDALVGGKDSNMVELAANMVDPLGDNFGVLANYGQDTKVTNLYSSEAWINLVKLARKWYQMGYVKKDIATVTDSSETQMHAGNAFSYFSYVKPNSKAEKDLATGYDTTVVQLTKPLRTTMSFCGGGFGIAHNSKDPAKAMQFLDWTYGSADFNNLMDWGIEGKDYVYTDKANKIIDYPSGVDFNNVSYHLDMGFGIPNQFIANIWKGNDPDIWKTYEKFNADALRSKAYGFFYDGSSVTNELAALSNVQSKYLNGLGSGSVDPDTTIPQFNKDLENAGINKVITVKQKQFDVWLKKQK